MTSFQRLRRGLDVFHRFSGVTEWEIFEGSSTSGPCLGIPIPPTLTLDPKAIADLTKLGWRVEGANWVFQP